LRAAEETAVATRFDREVVTLSTVAAVANAYFQVLASQERLKVARSNVQAATRVLTLTRERVQAGTVSALELAQQETVVNNQRASIPPLEITLRQNMFTLATLLGRAPESVTVSGGSLFAVALPRVTPGLPSDLLTQRPDIRMVEAQLASANASVERARAALLPSIQLTGQGGLQSAVLQTLLNPQSTFYNIAAGLTQPIFQGGQLLGQIDFDKGRQDELLQNYRRTVVSAFSDVNSALVAVQQQGERERLQREVVRSSREAFQVSETRLREGTVDLLTVLNTQLTLFQAEDVLAQVRLARLQAIISLYQALGGGWRLPEEALVRVRARALN
jgi:NodT family efflux transporter outer membrane factor (OMF) lipoprotein